MSEQERLSLPSQRRKYRNEPTVVGAICFSSAIEARRYQELLVLERAGQITNLRVHPRYGLQEGFRGRDGQWRRAITYEADFAYDENGRPVVEDLKGGPATQVFAIKSKLFEARYPEIELRVIRA